MKTGVTEMVCFCGSGKKFKDCCIEMFNKDDLGLSMGALSRIKSMEDFIKYALPLFKIFGGSKHGVEFSIKIANASWYLAEIVEAERHHKFDYLIEDFSKSIGLRHEDENMLVKIVNDMIKRYHRMFVNKKGIAKSNLDDQLEESWESYEEGKRKMAMDYVKEALRRGPKHVSRWDRLGPGIFGKFP